MSIENFRWMAAVIAAHPNRKVVGRTRLQKEMRLLQRCGLPSTYRFTLYFYGPYSDGIQSDIALLEQMGLVSETTHVSQEGTPYYVFEALEGSNIPQLIPYQSHIASMGEADAVVLELAATYDAFRELGFDHSTALRRLREKKGAKCGDGREDKAFELLRDLGLLFKTEEAATR